MPENDSPPLLLSARDRWLQRAHQALVGLLWATTGAVLLAWTLDWAMPVRAAPEPLAGLLGMTSTAVTWLYRTMARRLDLGRRALAQTRAELNEERYSLAHALAYGYVHNFLEPALSHLLDQAGPRAATLRLFVYLPAELGELEPAAIQRTVARLRGLGYQTRTLHLPLQPDRTREMLALERAPEDAHRYFDFPTTLLTLRHLVEYRLESRPDSFPDRARRELGERYIAEFRSELERHLRLKDLDRHVELVDRTLKPLATPPS